MRALGISFRPRYDATLRLIPGESHASLDEDSRRALFAEPFRVSPRSDRMGYRLQGPRLSLRAPIELLSSGVPMGALQLPPGGEPILLMADHQTTGGYPVIGYVATVDLGRAAQLRPGSALRFAKVSLDEAQRLYLDRERSLDALRRALSFPP
jgi:antagonist of KipI